MAGEGTEFNSHSRMDVSWIPISVSLVSLFVTDFIIMGMWVSSCKWYSFTNILSFVENENAFWRLTCPESRKEPSIWATKVLKLIYMTLLYGTGHGYNINMYEVKWTISCQWPPILLRFAANVDIKTSFYGCQFVQVVFHLLMFLSSSSSAKSYISLWNGSCCMLANIRSYTVTFISTSIVPYSLKIAPLNLAARFLCSLLWFFS